MAGVAGDFIPVDTSLIVQDSSFSFTTNDVLFVRTSTSLNISNSQLETVTGAETMLYRLGVALNSNTLKINLLQGKLT